MAFNPPVSAISGAVGSRWSAIERRWGPCVGQSVLGIGYATPYLNGFSDSAVRVLAFMPAEQGVVNWPEDGASSSALVDATMMPLPDACIDRVLVVHALELSESPGELLSEIWRILTPGGRVLIVAPNRRGVWAQLEATPVTTVPGPYTFDYTIPEGTASKIAMGRDPKIMPTSITANVGDTIRIVNDDIRDYMIGPFFVTAGQELAMRFTQPGELSGICQMNPEGEFLINVSA